ncbi:hypothetical protein BT63DRAFT_415616 [Microthyrium microscopicum]|uniref:Uncharacterized protein n=1 Tax=Microthyrium microscopicum TaxID=703497 RepID=A0A6A6U766_9PEZI|nr:hypothetical protein BT63DRAFT_415616 [Microthyrium microscopicum]
MKLRGVEETEQEKKICVDECNAGRKDRNIDSNTHGVNQIIAISQQTLNEILGARFNSQAKAGRDARLREFIHSDEEGEINAQLGAPYIQLVPSPSSSSEKADDKRVATVLFYVNFINGTFQWFKTPGTGKQTQALKNWSIAFRVPLGTTELSAVPEALASKLVNMKNNFSASQIFLNISAAAVINMELESSSMPGLPSDPEQIKTVRKEFERYMHRYLSFLKAGTFSVLGYTIRLEDKHAPKATVIPKSSRILVQTYKSQTEVFTKTYQDRRGTDMLLFLQQTAETGNELQSYDPTKAPNWVLPDPNYMCALSLQRHLFLESYLFEKLSDLNIACITFANDMFHQSYHPDSPVRNHHDWNIDPKGKPTTAPFKFSNSPEGPFAEYKPQGMDLGRDGLHWMNVMGTTKFDINWKLHLSLSTVTHGKLGVTLEQINPHKIHAYRDFFKREEPGPSILISIEAGPGQVKPHNELPDGPARDLVMAHEKRLWEQFTKGFQEEQIRKMKETDLNSQSPYVFPGGGDFFMKNPVFNALGDLIMDLNYEAPAIPIEYDFRLSVDTNTYKQITKPWVKMESNNDGTQLVLVPSKEQASRFILDNGDLVVVEEKKDEKNEAKFVFVKLSLLLPGTSDTKKKLIFMATAAWQDITTKRKKELGRKLDFATTGSLFEFKEHDHNDWHPTFVLSDETEPKIQLYTGKREDAMDKFFLLNPIY